MKLLYNSDNYCQNINSVMPKQCNAFHLKYLGKLSGRTETFCKIRQDLRCILKTLEFESIKSSLEVLWKFDPVNLGVFSLKQPFSQLGEHLIEISNHIQNHSIAQIKTTSTLLILFLEILPHYCWQHSKVHSLLTQVFT